VPLRCVQTTAGRAIPVLPGFTSPADAIVTPSRAPSHTPATERDPEMERLYLEELQVACLPACLLARPPCLAGWLPGSMTD
jgi:hypothetical protein